ncbi:hypothetical protein [Streptomyces sp. NBC_01233]|uniref:hypothetical protein n=1 Tax=Streptomyces sp. NBC_01233 TaxID=2903787 RepID=UPI002E162D00|nr:hypothetical protein OG332_38555 [Streptomyces sp. NBC_01233]
MRGWDFSWLTGRADGGGPSWDHERLARARLSRAKPPGHRHRRRRVPRLACPAAARLRGHRELGAQPSPGPATPLPAGGGGHRASGLDLPSGRFDLILNRHGLLDAASIRAALAPGGRLLTRQVGSRNQLELNEAVGIPSPADPDGWTLDVAVRALEGAGLRVTTAREETSPYTFHDIGAVIFQLRAIPWQFPGFEPSVHESALRRLDRHIRSTGGFTAHDHRFLIEARARG